MTGTHAAPPADGVAAVAAPSIIVIVAMSDEAEPFVSRATRVDEPIAVGGSLQRVVEIDGVELLLVQSGIGFVNAAGAATSAIVRSGSLEGVVPTVISAGTAAGMGEGIEIGDVVAGAEYVNLDADARVFGYRLGQVPGMPASFHADERLVEAAVAYDTSVASAARAGDASSAGDPSGASRGGWAVRPGLIASSDAFMTAERVIGVRSAFADVVDVDAVDMESMAIAQTCHVHHVPFVSVRGISDLAGPDAHDVHDENLALTAGRSADVTMHLVRAIVAG
ncbi:5'-methylthioadenosine/S-adenosylhomocysteine nucleosidase [Frigoribacterium sp. VKM Ac-2836]|uniref:5'-methylthioadenosine/S-adenosylhomocysteine nucleosidase n=1 Tax=Frigoribacterium sp. VKM Ac-2836 TaxID=2739014 RepID=UPI001564D8C1|nr:5'-methylthioadenosine/S-adenosylhomocysteine nucleosidase [Frigoribacterium sp. VKM Ac-2836]NRD26538.1 5'-methylthioadenosine/S-adenosylhomocysteine nucleosidase [Frigoribacterium sp. VKM Ac-2836]